MEYDAKWISILSARDKFRDEHHRKKWFEGVGVTKEGGVWALLAFRHPARKPPSLEDSFLGHALLVRAKKVKSHPRNKKKTARTKARKKARSKARKEAKTKRSKAARPRRKKSRGGK